MRKRKTREQLRNRRIAANRAKMPEQLFSDLERQVLLDRLNTLTPDREKNSQVPPAKHYHR